MYRIALLLWLFCVGNAINIQCYAADRAEWQGMKVLPKMQCVIKIGEQVLDATKFDLPYVVQKVNGDWLWIGDTTKGWVQRSQVLTVADAIGYYTQVLAESGESSRSFKLRGLAWYLSGKPDNAIADFNQAIRLDPQVPSGYLGRAQCRRQKGEYQKAFADYDEAVRLAPKNLRTYYTRGLARTENKEYAKANADFDVVSQLDPKFAGAYVGRGQVFILEHEYDKAIAQLNHAIRLDAFRVDAYTLRGESMNAKKEYDKAIADFNQEIRLQPKSSGAYVDRAAAWRGKAEFDKAIADYAEAFRLAPDDAVIKNAFAWFLATCPEGRYRNGKRAIALATSACDSSGWNQSAYIDTLAASYAEAGDFAHAITYQRQAIDRSAADSDETEGMKGRLRLYSEKTPYRE